MLARAGSLAFPAMVAGLAAATFFALRGDGRDGFWANHPMLGALVSGALLFGMGVLVVERLVERRNARRWAAAAIAANRDLGHALDDALSALWLAHSDAAPERPHREEWDWTPAWRARRTTPPPGRDQLAVLREELPLPDYEGPALTPAARVERLLANPEFVGFARDLIDHHRDVLRDGAKEWAGLMMWAQHSQELLNALGLYAEKHLSRVAYHLYCHPESSEQHRREAVEQWILADVKGRVLLNTFWGTSTRYRFALPDEARGVPLMTAFRYEDTVGRWRPPPHPPLPAREHLQREARRRWHSLIGR